MCIRDSTKAYKISISGLPAQKFGTESAYVPNPIKTLGNQLANLKSGSIWFELASFDGGSRAGVTPSEATATIVDVYKRQMAGRATCLNIVLTPFLPPPNHANRGKAVKIGRAHV